PLAGHELGHSVWNRESLRDDFEDVAALAVVDEVRRRNDIVGKTDQLRRISIRKARTRLERDWLVFRAACQWLLRQLEEMFCDFVGLYLFGESYARAFSYFLSPDFPGPQSPRYPLVETRMQQLFRAAESFEEAWKQGNYILSPDIRDTMRRLPPYGRTASLVAFPLTPDPWRDVVDTVAINLVPKLIEKIVQLGRRQNWQELRSFSNSGRATIASESFQWAVPAANAAHFSDILNAAWDVERNSNLWKTLPSLSSLDKDESDRRRREILREVVLKNIEVFEYEEKCSREIS
ncbi:MAG TPA: hypothetical protein VLH83_05930, partial [Chthoniobacterales bacterium]|nr:hypothetical protein [Chthoniobacterales bacterium]